MVGRAQTVLRKYAKQKDSLKFFNMESKFILFKSPLEELRQEFHKENNFFAKTCKFYFQLCVLPYNHFIAFKATFIKFTQWKEKTFPIRLFKACAFNQFDKSIVVIIQVLTAHKFSEFFVTLFSRYHFALRFSWLISNTMKCCLNDFFFNFIDLPHIYCFGDGNL